MMLIVNVKPSVRLQSLNQLESLLVYLDIIKKQILIIHTIESIIAVLITFQGQLYATTASNCKCLHFLLAQILHTF